MRFVFVVMFFLCGCAGTSSLSLQKDYCNILDITNWPQGIREGISLFSDLGAWHGFAFIPDSARMTGGFSGPLSMASNYAVGPYTANALVEVDGVLQKTADAKIEKSYFPGRMVQSFAWEELTLTQEIVFVNNRASLLRTRVRNMGGPKEVKVTYEGRFFTQYFQGKTIGQGKVLLEFPATKCCFEIAAGESCKAEVKDGLYRFDYGIRKMKRGEEREDVFVYSAYFNDESDSVKYPVLEGDPFTDSEPFFEASASRWDHYLTKLLENKPALLEDLKYRRLAVKCLMTLMANWRSAAHDLLHDGGYPSYWGFSTGFWSWDSWKIAAGVCRWEPELAKSHIRALFDYQTEEGMIPDFVSRIKYINNLRDTKPPLASWAVNEIYEADGDLAFVGEMFDRLLKYHRWWYAYRDIDGDGLCEYGSTDGTLKAAAWESGMDNAVRFDSVGMLKGRGPRAWSMDQESVDLNAYLYDEKVTLARFARLLKREDVASLLEKEADGLAHKIRTIMFDRETGYFFDVKTEGHSVVRVYGPEGWLPLWAKVADREQAGKVKDIMMDGNHFNSYVPLGTLDLSHPKLEPQRGYWRGPVWLDQVYFGIRGLRNYGYDNEANELTLKVLNNCQGLLENQPIQENYNPLTGERLNAPHFGWSAAHLLLMMFEYK